MQAKMFTGGLYLATNLAMFPFSVSTIIKARFKSNTLYTAAAATAWAVEYYEGGVRALISWYTLL